jgi:hypothetical protein
LALRIFPGKLFCQTKIENLRMTALGDEDVGGLDVPVDDALGVCCVKCVGDRDCDVQELFQLHRSASDGVP